MRDENYEGGQLDTQAPMIDEEFEKSRALSRIKRERLVEKREESEQAIRH